MSLSSLDRVVAAVFDGRSSTLRFIQKQLLNLTQSLTTAQSKIENAIREDAGYTAAEASSEFYLAFRAVKDEYTACDPKTTLEQEYSIAHSKDNDSNQVAIGCVYIIPSRHNAFYSIIAPLAASIAAGNCIIVEMKNTVSELNSVLKNVLLDALDNDTIAFVDSKPKRDDFMSKHCVILDSTAREGTFSSSKELLCSNSITAAVIDRTANLQEAARELVRARFAFQGRSPYAPDVVLVNEFSLKTFCNAVTRFSTDFSTNRLEATVRADGAQNRKLNGSVTSPTIPNDDSYETLIATSNCQALLVRDRASTLIGTKITQPRLIIHPITSMDDAIDFLNTRSNERLLAAYLFSAPPAAKYLSQFLSTSVSFTNGIPAELLLGPAAPVGFVTCSHPRFNKSMFMIPKPEYINRSERTQVLAGLLDKNDHQGMQMMIRQETGKPLPPTGQPPGGAIGFFEQGLRLGGSILLSSIIATGFALKVYGYPLLVRWVR